MQEHQLRVRGQDRLGARTVDEISQAAYLDSDGHVGYAG
jgi:hypothetical protein